jgi:hypothetical protein
MHVHVLDRQLPTVDKPTNGRPPRAVVRSVFDGCVYSLVRQSS